MEAQHNLSQSNGRSSQSAALTPRYFLGETIAILLCPAANGKVFAVTIDREDLPRVLAVGNWHVANFDAANGRVNLYCYTKANGRTLYLHRFILGAPKDRRIEVDHIHHRNLDNRKSEIRLATKSENKRNQKRSRTFAAQVTPIGGNYAEKEKQGGLLGVLDSVAGSGACGLAAGRVSPSILEVSQ